MKDLPKSDIQINDIICKMLDEKWTSFPSCEGKLSLDFKLNHISKNLRESYSSLPNKGAAIENINFGLVEASHIYEHRKSFNASRLRFLKEGLAMDQKKINDDLTLMEAGNVEAKERLEPFLKAAHGFVRKQQCEVLRCDLYQSIIDVAKCYYFCSLADIVHEPVKYEDYKSITRTLSGAFLHYQSYTYYLELWTSQKAFAQSAQSKSNSRFSVARDNAKEMAQEFYEKPENMNTPYGVEAKNIRNVFSQNLNDFQLTNLPTITTIKGWIKEVVPVEATKRGRRPNNPLK